MNTFWKVMLINLITAVFLTCSATAQRNERSLSCEDRGRSWGDGKRHCEMKEQTIPAADGKIRVDGKRNGGISIKGWDRNEILVRSQINANAPTEDEARALVNEVRVLTGGANIYAEGPESRNNRWWAVSYEIFIPRESDVWLKAHNGGISVESVRGAMEFETLNGGISLRDVNGKIKGRTTNGGLSVKLSGNRWEGDGLDIETRNGGINLYVPENYSAKLETGTVNGGVKLSFPITVQGRLDIEKTISTNLGSGGATIRLMTTNGGVSVSKQ